VLVVIVLFNITVRLLLSCRACDVGLVHWFLFFLVVLSCCFSLGPRARAFFKDLCLKMKTVHSFETFGSSYPLVHHYIPEE